MKNTALLLALALIIVLLSGCGTNSNYDIVATTLPVYEFTQQLCNGTDLQVARLISENISCVHDYTLKVDQMRLLEQAQTIVISGADFEDFLSDVIRNEHKIIDSSYNINLFNCNDHHEHSHKHEHNTYDPHIWLSPSNAKAMAENICAGLIKEFPEFQTLFETNLILLQSAFDDLIVYAQDNLKDLKTRKIITFHDGFSYMADAFSLEILHAIEEESGSEASAAELIELVNIVNAHNLSSLFIECNGSSSAASVIASETGCTIYALDMSLSGDSYFDAMYYNIDTLKEALK